MIHAFWQGADYSFGNERVDAFTIAEVESLLPSFLAEYSQRTLTLSPQQEDDGGADDDIDLEEYKERVFLPIITRG